MEPQPFGYGYFIDYGKIRGTAVRFQWGHGLSAMDTAFTKKHVEWLYEFQWGHGLSAMDTTAATFTDILEQ